MSVKIEVHKKYLKDMNDLIIETLERSSMPESEKKYKSDRLKKGVSLENRKTFIDNYYISTIHEIKTYELLSKYGNVKVASDSKCEAGTDFKFLDYNIECVSCTSGDIQKK